MKWQANLTIFVDKSYQNLPYCYQYCFNLVSILTFEVILRSYLQLLQIRQSPRSARGRPQTCSTPARCRTRTRGRRCYRPRTPTRRWRTQSASDQGLAVNKNSLINDNAMFQIKDLNWKTKLRQLTFCDLYQRSNYKLNISLKK